MYLSRYHLIFVMIDPRFFFNFQMKTFFYPREIFGIIKIAGLFTTQFTADIDMLCRFSDECISGKDIIEAG